VLGPHESTKGTTRQENAPRLLHDRKTAAQLLSISVRFLEYLIADGFVAVQCRCKRILISHDELIRFSTRPEPSAKPMSDSATEQWIADVQASYAEGTLPKWQIRAVKNIANWKWNAEFGSNVAPEILWGKNVPGKHPTAVVPQQGE
jgi:hypothetical protein